MGSEAGAGASEAAGVREGGGRGSETSTDTERGARPFEPARLLSLDTTMDNSEAMEKQNGHAPGSGRRGAAGSMVQAPDGQGGGEQTWTHSMGQA